MAEGGQRQDDSMTTGGGEKKQVRLSNQKRSSFLTRNATAGGHQASL